MRSIPILCCRNEVFEKAEQWDTVTSQPQNLEVNKLTEFAESLNTDELNKLIAKHEQEIANPILDYISKRDDFKLIGKSIINNKNRAPTISFIVKNKSSKTVSDFLVKNKIATRNDNFYAWRCLEALNIKQPDGVVRVSMVHYNNIDEVNI